MIHEPNTRLFDTANGMLSTQRYGKYSERKLEHCHLHKDGLFWALQVDGLKADYMQGHILAGLGIQIVRFGWKPCIEASERLDYYIDIINLSQQDNRWSYRDLYLDIAIFEAKAAEILDTDEYLEAIKAGFFEDDEADFALNTTHQLMNDLAKHEYSLEAYLETKEIRLEWV